tara:strand:- start:1189 stop:1530 length:342 start_codon:yes stop_codon:yes gene_type:complete
MRKITSDAVDAFENFESFKRSNTSVCITKRNGEPVRASLILHGHEIAEKRKVGLKITLAGYNTRTTRERLNGISGVHIICRNGQAFIKGGSCYQTIDDDEEIVFDKNREITSL